MIIFRHVHIEQRRSEEFFYTYTETTTNSVYRAYLYTAVLLFFLIEDSVVCGTPLLTDKSYLLIFRSIHNCSIRNITASSNNIFPYLYLFYSIVGKEIVCVSSGGAILSILLRFF